MKDNWNYRRGDIYLVDLGTNIGSEQGGCRPVLAIQNNVGNHYGPTLIVVPITSRFWKKANQPTHSVLEEYLTLQAPPLYLQSRLSPLIKQG